jgi:aspartyl-tRNA(Asn)/glutamyl-tRNA(Gln) amidotransferase subunit B
MEKFTTVIGLEIHAQILTRTKLFCGCPSAFGDAPNSHLCPVCLGLPGALPVLNRQAVELAVRAALALGFRIDLESVFARKNYFYPDLPKGYQITQFDRPLAKGGSIPLDAPEGSRPIALTRLHLEEDAGKSFHGQGSGGGSTLLDFNRSGVPLIEIVTEPELETPEEAGALLRRIRQVLVSLGVCTGRMEEGSLRCDANVSLREAGGGLGPKVEVKNLNSFRFVERALRHEIARQAGVLRAGCAVASETRMYNEASGATTPMRSKEECQDYRYFPEPDLSPLLVDPSWVTSLREGLPELPHDRRRRFVETLGLSVKDAEVLVDDGDLADYFEVAASASGHPKAAANWVLGEVLRTLKGTEEGLAAFAVKISSTSLGELIQKTVAGKFSTTLAKEVFARMAQTGEDLPVAARALGADQSLTKDEVSALVERAIEENPTPVAQYRAGQVKTFGFLVGAAMRMTGGKADPALVNRILREKLMNG